MTYGNGLVETRSYNPRLQPTEMRSYNPSTQADVRKLTWCFATTPRCFTGHPRDPESSLDYFGARYYSSMVGRFGSVDPSQVSVDLTNLETLNRYAYCLGNPLKMVDSNGKWPTYVHDLITDTAFSRILDRYDVNILKATSRWVDTDQSTSGAYKHGMKATRPGMG